MRKKTHEEFTKQVFNLVENEYTVLGKYESTHKKVLTRHNKCGCTWMVEPNAFLKGSRCPKCYGNIRKSTNSFKHEVEKLVGNEYAVIDEYKNNRTKIKFKHNKCGTVYKERPYKFLEGCRCPICTKLSRANCMRKSVDKFKSEIMDLVGTEYSLISDYKNAKAYVTMKHNKCGNVYQVTPTAFLYGNRCPKCSSKITGKKLSKTTTQFKKELNHLYGNEFELIGEYKSQKYKVNIKHSKCKNTFTTFPTYILGGTGCPYCSNRSSGEKRITNILKSNGIKFKKEYSDSRLKYKHKLRFDFALFKSDRLICLLEYDGIQHFKPIEYFGGEKALEGTKFRDKLKNSFCKQNNIPLIRIPYWEKDVENYIKESLKEVI